MPEEVYEVLALGMRYWFILLGLLIVLRVFAWQWQEHRARRRRLRELPDAGMIGELRVLRGSDELPEGAALALPYEGTLGFVRSCDVPVPCGRIAAEHLDFSFQPGLGLLVYPRYRCVCRVDGRRVTSRSKPRKHPLVQHSILRVGEAELEVCLFDGLAARLRPRRQAEEPEEPDEYDLYDGQDEPDGDDASEDRDAYETPPGKDAPQADAADPGRMIRAKAGDARQPTLFGQPIQPRGDADEGGRCHGP